MIDRITQKWNRHVELRRFPSKNPRKLKLNPEGVGERVSLKQKEL